MCGDQGRSEDGEEGDRWIMISLRPPSERRIDELIQSQNDFDFTYQEIGQTSGELPAKYFSNEHVVELGCGIECFDAARENLQQRRCLQLDWARLSSDGPPRLGQNIAIVARVMRVWTTNFCRVVDVQSQCDSGGGLCYAFAVGTLPRHIMIGEERFTVSLDGQTEIVRFSIRSFSRGRTLAAVVSAPLIRHYQRQFVDDVATAMKSDMTVWKNGR